MHARKTEAKRRCTHFVCFAMKFMKLGSKPDSFQGDEKDQRYMELIVVFPLKCSFYDLLCLLPLCLSSDTTTLIMYFPW